MFDPVSGDGASVRIVAAAGWLPDNEVFTACAASEAHTRGMLQKVRVQMEI